MGSNDILGHAGWRNDRCRANMHFLENSIATAQAIWHHLATGLWCLIRIGTLQEIQRDMYPPLLKVTGRNKRMSFLKVSNNTFILLSDARAPPKTCGQGHDNRCTLVSSPEELISQLLTQNGFFLSMSRGSTLSPYQPKAYTCAGTPPPSFPEG